MLIALFFGALAQLLTFWLKLAVAAGLGWRGRLGAALASGARVVVFATLARSQGKAGEEQRRQQQPGKSNGVHVRGGDE